MDAGVPSETARTDAAIEQSRLREAHQMLRKQAAEAIESRMLLAPDIHPELFCLYEKIILAFDQLCFVCSDRLEKAHVPFAS